ncbi:MAG: OsmC family protein, partial [Nitrososphaerales archaeon]
SLAFCQMSIYANVASSMRIPIESLEISVTGKRDNRGLLGIADVRPGYNEITLETNIKANGQEERILRMAELVEKHCPVYDNLAHPVPIKNNISLNGNKIGTL